MIIVALHTFLPLFVFIPSLLELGFYHIHLVDVVALHIVFAPLFVLAELAFLDTLCSFPIHVQCLFLLDIMELV